MKNEAMILLNMNPNVNCPESSKEPIVTSLKKNDQLMFEKLIDLGANALNNQFPVVENYLKSTFFNFEVLKKMKKYNISVGCPIQTALTNGNRNSAVFLWTSTSKEQHLNASKTVDKQHRTILVLSILNTDGYFFDELVKPGFDLTTPDAKGKTPFIHLCAKNHIQWMERIMPLLSIEEMGVADNSNYSALTYICNNGNTKLAEELFLKGINVFNIISDQNMIIAKYATVLNNFTELRKNVVQKLSEARANMESAGTNITKAQKHISELKVTFYDYCNQARDPNKSKSEIDRLNEFISMYRGFLNNWEDTLDKSQSKYNEAKRNEEFYKKKLEVLDKATRKDILYNKGNIFNL